MLFAYCSTPILEKCMKCVYKCMNVLHYWRSSLPVPIYRSCRHFTLTSIRPKLKQIIATLLYHKNIFLCPQRNLYSFTIFYPQTGFWVISKCQNVVFWLSWVCMCENQTLSYLFKILSKSSSFFKYQNVRDMVNSYFPQEDLDFCGLQRNASIDIKKK